MRVLLPFLLFVAACDRGPEVPTSAENRDLDSAADLLDQADNDLASINAGELEEASDGSTDTKKAAPNGTALPE